MKSKRRTESRSPKKDGKFKVKSNKGKFNHGDFKNKGPHRRGGAQSEVLKAVVDKNWKGFAFLIFENKSREDLFVPPHEAAHLFPGDRVEVALDSRGQPIQIKVLEHRFKQLVGRFFPNPEKRIRSGWVLYERKKTREEIPVPNAPIGIQPGDWVRIELNFEAKGRFPVFGEIVEVYGQVLPPSADVEMVAAEFNLTEKHSQGAIDEALEFGTKVSEADIKDRIDLRNVPFITIDGETARDFDDAIFVERHKSGYFLWVAIADVSHYVTEGTKLNEEALARGTSVYFPERAFHMLPGGLSENLCSLRPNEPRLSLVAKMRFDREGERHEVEIMEAVIQSQRRATYNEIQKEWEQEKQNRQWKYRPHFELYELIKKQRQKRGSLDFELPEPEILVKKTGEVISIRIRTRLETHRLIEEFMVAANEAVTEWMMSQRWPFIYRVHDEPSPVALQRFQSLAATVGVKVSLEELLRPGTLAELIIRFADHPAASLLNMTLLRSMKQAVYRAVHGIHFGLASKAYTHFTSPIRRYPDLVVHRLIRRALAVKRGEERLPKKDAVALEQKLAEICDHCSYRERLAADAEREIIKIKQVRLMAEKLGQEFDSRITGLINSGIFVQIDDPYVEGMIPLESLTDDLYEYNEERMIVSGKKKKQVLRIGDKIRVQVVRADLDRRQIEFQVVEQG